MVYSLSNLGNRMMYSISYLGNRMVYSSCNGVFVM